MKVQFGFSLLEFMLASAISVSVLTGLLHIYLRVQHSYQNLIEVANEHERARAALYILQNSIRGAGYLGCRNQGINFPGVNTNQTLRIYQAFEQHWVPILPPVLQRKAKQNNDVLFVQKASYQQSDLLENTQQKNYLHVSNQEIFKKNDYLIISDCMHNELLQVKQVKQEDKEARQIIIVNKSLEHLYQRHASIAKLEQYFYFIAVSKYKDHRGNSVDSLYIHDTKNTEELISGISKLHIKLLANNQLELSFSTGKHAWHSSTTLH